MALNLACVVVLVGMMVMGSPIGEAAITCDQVATAVTPCMDYLTYGGVVPPPCCDGVRSLNATATTTTDRQDACKCLQTTAPIVNGSLNLGLGLPGMCGVTIPFQISPDTDCSGVE